MLSLGSVPSQMCRAWRGPACHGAHFRAHSSHRSLPAARTRARIAPSAASPVHFSELPLDRSAHLRSQPEQLAQLLSHPDTLLLPLHRGKALVGPAEAAEAAVSSPTKLGLLLGGRQQPPLPLVAHSFADGPGRPTAEGRSPRWVPLALPASAAAPGRPLEHSMDSSMGLIFLGVEPGTGRAVFACELMQPAAVTSVDDGDSGSSKGAEADGLAASTAGSNGSSSGSSSSSGGSSGAGSSPSITPAAAAASEAEPQAASQAAGAIRDAAALSQWADVRSAGQEMAGPDAAVLALATGLARWHASAAFCTRSGRPMAAVQGGYGRAPASQEGARPSLLHHYIHTPNSLPARAQAAVQGGHGRAPARQEGASANGQGRVRAVYPRIDPAVIVAATCGDWLLLGRKRSWDAGRYSLLAGFCEVGETLEQASVREVLEESGVELDLSSLVYHSSQPWPFPQSLMIGFVGAAAGQAAGRNTPPFHLLPDVGRAAAHDVGMTQQEIREHILPLLPPVKVDQDELEDVRWFHRSYLLTALNSSGGTPFGHCNPRYYPRAEEGGFRIPGKYALANRIIWGWLQREGAATSGSISSGAGSSSGGAGSSVSGKEEKSGGWLGDLLADVSIDEGTFKYVLMRVTEVAPARQTQAESSSSPSSDHVSSAAGTHALRSKLIVRGDSRAAYHDHILSATRAEAAALAQKAAGTEGQPSYMSEEGGPSLKIEPLGGGRMEHYHDQRLLSVYGYSSAFGQAPHDITAALLRRWLPFHDLTVSYDGY